MTKSSQAGPAHPLNFFTSIYFAVFFLFLRCNDTIYLFMVFRRLRLKLCGVLAEVSAIFSPPHL